MAAAAAAPKAKQLMPGLVLTRFAHEDAKIPFYEYQVQNTLFAEIELTVNLAKSTTNVQFVQDERGGRRGMEG